MRALHTALFLTLPIPEQLDEQPHPNPCTARWNIGPLFFNRRRPRNIEMNPRNFFHEFAQKYSSDDGACCSCPHIPEISGITFQIFKILIPERQSPDLLSGFGGSFFDLFQKRFIIPEKADHKIPQCNNACSRHCSSIDDRFWL